MVANNATEEEIQESAQYLNLLWVARSTRLMERALRHSASNLDLRGVLSVRRNYQVPLLVAKVVHSTGA